MKGWAAHMLARTTGGSCCGFHLSMAVLPQSQGCPAAGRNAATCEGRCAARALVWQHGAMTGVPMYHTMNTRMKEALKRTRDV